jgi:hypothetical protein
LVGTVEKASALEGARGTRGGSGTFDDLWQKAGGVEHFALDANSFDSTTLAILAAAAAKSADPAAIQSKIHLVTQPGAVKFSPTNLSDALKAVWAGQPIDYVGVAGAFAANGDPTISRFDIFEYRNGKLNVIKQVDAAE